jgi:hypothetical protein
LNLICSAQWLNREAEYFNGCLKFLSL